VDPEDFTDNRAPNPLLKVSGLPYIPEPTYEVEKREDWYLSSIETDLTASVWVAARHEVFGYAYTDDLSCLLLRYIAN
jgi:hypothetical protein